MRDASLDACRRGSGPEAGATMSETTTTSTSTVADEQARFRAFTALGLALVGLMGGGVLSTAGQLLVMRALEDIDGDRLYVIGAAAAPLALGAVACYLASTATASPDPLARPVARAAMVIAVVAVVGSVLLMMVGIDSR
ncbi:hypothetical protein GCM10023339_04200 [Alloalcanivorax gelatiniphagus]